MSKGERYVYSRNPNYLHITIYPNATVAFCGVKIKGERSFSMMPARFCRECIKANTPEGGQ